MNTLVHGIQAQIARPPLTVAVPSPPQAPSHVYGGHGSHVTNVRFTHDDGHLVSLGGKDTSVFQWRVLGGPATPCSRSPCAPEPGGDPDPR